MKKIALEKQDLSEEDLPNNENDNKFKCAQHRQYLSYGGFGSGTPFQREKQYAKFKALEAANNVLSHRISKVTAEEKALMDKKLSLKHKIKTKYGFDRLVEDLIQESMSKGEFNNLAGSGKPLSENHNLNPYVDFVTYKLNQVLINNGFTPEWITLQKEINEEIRILRDTLAVERLKFNKLMRDEELDKWNFSLNKLKKMESQINNKINKYNFLVPILNKQMILINLNKEANLVVETGQSREDVFENKKEGKENDTKHPANESSFLQLLNVIFKN